MKSISTILCLSAIALANDAVLPVFNVGAQGAKSDETLTVTDERIVFGRCNGIHTGELARIQQNDSDPKIERLAECIRSHFRKGNDRKGYEGISILLKIDRGTLFSRIFTIMNTLAYVGIRKMLFAGKNSKGEVETILVKVPGNDKRHDKLLPAIIVDKERISFGITKGWVAAYEYKKDKSSVLDTLRRDIDSIRNAYAPDCKLDHVILAFDDGLPFQEVATVMEFCVSAGLSDIAIAKLRDSGDSSQTVKQGSSRKIGGRPRDDVQKTVSKHIKSLKSIYDQRRRENPELEGKIVVRFAINDIGRVAKAEIIEQTVQDTTFIRQIVGELVKWDFGKIRVKGDVTEVIYPFVFAKP